MQSRRRKAGQSTRTVPRCPFRGGVRRLGSAPLLLAAPNHRADPRMGQDTHATGGMSRPHPLGFQRSLGACCPKRRGEDGLQQEGALLKVAGPLLRQSLPPPPPSGRGHSLSCRRRRLPDVHWQTRSDVGQVEVYVGRMLPLWFPRQTACVERFLMYPARPLLPTHPGAS